MATKILIAPVYIVHKNGKPLVWPVKDSHGIVCFSNFKTASRIAIYTESHYLTHKEWPNGSSFSFKNEVSPTILGIRETDFVELTNKCAPWNLKLLMLSDIKKSNVVGDVLSFDLPHDQMVNHLNTLLGDIEI